MRNKLYGLKDLKVGAYIRIYIEDNHIEASRQMQYAVMQPENKISSYPAEYQIDYLGEIDGVTGRIDCPESPEYVISGIAARNEAIERLRKLQQGTQGANVGELVNRLEKSIKVD